MALHQFSLIDVLNAFSVADLRLLCRELEEVTRNRSKGQMISIIARNLMEPVGQDRASLVDHTYQIGAKGTGMNSASFRARSSRSTIAKIDLQTAVETHLIAGGFLHRIQEGNHAKGSDKQQIRDLHSLNRQERLAANRKLIQDRGQALLSEFAAGNEVVPELIRPQLVEVHPETTESELFRFATALWSVPVSQGFGRRLRFLVRDGHNGKLIGLFALGDPVFNLSARDDFVGWTPTDRRNRLVHVMDAYVVGSVPPYSQLIGGKLIAALMCSDEVKRAYEKKYLASTSIISGESKRARLVLLTTTSALGRSSIYNRLAIPNGPRFMRIGNTKGYGHFHVSGDVFELFRRYLEQIGHPYASGHRFGMGPNWRFRVVRAALDHIGISGESVLRHGIEREVYAIPLAHNWKAILLGTNVHVKSCTLPSYEIIKYCLNRWMIPRSDRDPRFKIFQPSSLLSALNNGGPPPCW